MSAQAVIVWLIRDMAAEYGGVLMYIASTEDKAKQWLRDNTTATERTKPNFWARWEIEAHAVDR